MVTDKEGKENSKSYQAIEGESDASTGLSKPVQDNNSIPGTMVPEETVSFCMHLSWNSYEVSIELVPYFVLFSGHATSCFIWLLLHSIPNYIVFTN